MLRNRMLPLVLVASAALATPAWAGGFVCWMADLETRGEVDEYAAELRAQGPEGFAKALDILEGLNNQTQRDRERKQIAQSDDDATWSEREKLARKAIDRIIDLVAGQRDAAVSRLYWYTDLNEAKAAAEESSKPILSLRMLGKLTDEYSCANSRFFRTALYANGEISAYLREHYILHWQSVRPVPRVTIDFGDGRKLERTITGNSAHYVLDAAGRPLDVLPGLYGPKPFAEWLERLDELAGWLAKTNEEGRRNQLVEYHTNRRNIVDEQMWADVAAFAPQLLNDGRQAAPFTEVKAPAKIDAREAARITVAKGRAEAPLLASIAPSIETLQAQDDNFWRQVAAAHAADARLDEASVDLIRQENPTAAEAGVRAESKSVQEDPLVRLLRNFEESMAIDAVKNEYTLHRQIHEWFARGSVTADVHALNERVYAELFLTPSSDPWLGLAPADAYTALDGGGLTAAK